MYFVNMEGRHGSGFIGRLPVDRDDVAQTIGTEVVETEFDDVRPCRLAFSTGLFTVHPSQ